MAFDVLAQTKVNVHPENEAKLLLRVTRAATAALASKGYVSVIDVLLGIGWLDASSHKRWQTGQLPYLEQAVNANLSRVSAAMKLFRSWAMEQGLLPSETAYVARTPQRPRLRFSRSGDGAIERAYCTHWVSPALSERKRQRIQEKAGQPLELVVIEPTGEWRCNRCGGSGTWLLMEPAGPCCMACAGLGGLEFLPAGDATLSRRVKVLSSVHAVGVRFSRARKRYERQGLLVEPEALRLAEQETRADSLHRR